MKNKILKFQIFSIIFDIILGTLLHFTYEWSNNNMIIGAFSAVNESTWEHLKLVFFPMLVTIIIGYNYINNHKSNFICAKTIGIIIAMLFIIIFFYTYTGIICTNFAILDIGSFFVAVILGEYIAYRIMISDFVCNNKIAIVTLVLLLLCFVFFTYVTPQIGLFKNPL